MTRVQVAVFTAVALTCGCSSPRSDKASSDAGVDPRGAADAYTGHRSPNGAGSSDARCGNARSGTDAAFDAAISISPLTLTPPFSTAIHDYYVRCAAGENALTVSMTAGPGSTIALLQPITTPASTDGSATLAVAENEAIVVGVTDDCWTETYWIRCLPHDFPQMKMTLHPDAGSPTPGYYLVGNAVMAPDDHGYAAAIDGNGVPVWYHTTQTGQGAVDVDNVVPGMISFVPSFNATFGSVSGEFELHDLDAGTTTYVEPHGTPLDPHELRYLPNGDYLVFSDPIVHGVDLSRLGPFGADTGMVACDIQEVDPTGAVTWQWSATDHFDPVRDTTEIETWAVNGVDAVAVFHCNSIDVDAAGDLLVSARDMDSIFLVSKATGAVVWKMGGAAYTKEGAPYIQVTGDPMGSFVQQHDARFLPNGDISMFDDQSVSSYPWRAVVYSYDLTTGTATMVWQYQGTATSAMMGSFRVLGDGSRVIGWGLGGAPDLAFSEVDVNGNDVLDFGFPDGTESYRAIKIPLSAFDIGLLRASAGTN